MATLKILVHIVLMSYDRVVLEVWDYEHVGVYNNLFHYFSRLFRMYVYTNNIREVPFSSCSSFYFLKFISATF
jgi:hypothetical protein